LNDFQNIKTPLKSGHKLRKLAKKVSEMREIKKNHFSLPGGEKQKKLKKRNNS